jgi:octopine/nopaline transport system permease protein
MNTFLAVLTWGPRGWLDELTFATGLTLVVSLTAFVFGLGFGSLAAAGKLSSSSAARSLADGYTTVFRGVPDLLVIYLFYFGGSQILGLILRPFGFTGFVGLPPFLTATIAIGLVNGAYQAEVLRGAYLAIARGEIEAARACGMSQGLLFRRIVAPQVLRYALPGLGNVWQLCLKEGALVTVVGLTIHLPAIDVFQLVQLPELRFNDLLRQAQIGAGSTREPFPFYVVAAAFYLILTTLSTLAFRRAETRARVGLRQAT